MSKSYQPVTMTILMYGNDPLVEETVQVFGAILAQTVCRHGETFSTGTDNNLIRMLQAAKGKHWFNNLLGSTDQNLRKELPINGEITYLILSHPF